jgi:hypothetical protein
VRDHARIEEAEGARLRDQRLVGLDERRQIEHRPAGPDVVRAELMGEDALPRPRSPEDDVQSGTPDPAAQQAIEPFDSGRELLGANVRGRHAAGPSGIMIVRCEMRGCSSAPELTPPRPCAALERG